MKAVTLSKEDVFKGPTNRNVPGACAILAQKKDYLISSFSSLKSQEVEKGHFTVIMERLNAA